MPVGCRLRLAADTRPFRLTIESERFLMRTTQNLLKLKGAGKLSINCAAIQASRYRISLNAMVSRI